MKYKIFKNIFVNVNNASSLYDSHSLFHLIQITVPKMSIPATILLKIRKMKFRNIKGLP